MSSDAISAREGKCPAIKILPLSMKDFRYEMASVGGESGSKVSLTFILSIGYPNSLATISAVCLARFLGLEIIRSNVIPMRLSACALNSICLSPSGERPRCGSFSLGRASPCCII